MKKFFALLIATILILINGLTVAAATPTAISSESELMAMKAKGDYFLANDIVLSSEFTPVAKFTGTFDGRGKKIVNLKIAVNAKAGERVYAGLFTEFDNAKVENLTLENVKISVKGGGTVYAGAVVGRNTLGGSISNCRVSGEIDVDSSEADVYVGAIAGKSIGLVSLCESSAKITVNATRAYVGGIVGEHSRTEFFIEKCINFGDITVSATADTNYAGGIVAKVVTSAENCANYGSVSLSAAGQGWVGGIAAEITNGEINTCYSGGTLNCNTKGEGFMDPIAAAHTNKFSNNHYLDKIISGLNTAGVKTASALESKSVSNASIFSGFDFNDTWQITANGPTLKCITAAKITADQKEETTSSTPSSSVSSPSAGSSSVVSSTTGEGASQSQNAGSASPDESRPYDDPFGDVDSVTKKNTPPIWIFVIIVVVVGAGAAAAIYVMNNKERFFK